MAYQRIHKPSPWSPPPRGKHSQLGPRPSAAQAQQDSHGSLTQEETENESFYQDKFEAFGLQLRGKSGTITPAEQERLGVLQAKMDDFWTQRMELAKAQSNLLKVPIHNAQATETTEPEAPKAGVQAKPMKPSLNKTGLPDNLKARVENLSGYSLDDVRVHYNSRQPARLKALAYTRGTEIHVAPEQEQYLPHEAWHVVQQMQGRVRPTRQMKGVQISDNGRLEKEADAMGTKALRMQPDSAPRKLLQPSSSALNSRELVQRVRMKLELPGFPISLARLEDFVGEIDEQIRSLREESSAEVDNGFIDFGRITEWREQLTARMQRLRDLDDGGSYTKEQVRSREDQKLDAYHAAFISCGNIWKALDSSFTEYTEHVRLQNESRDLEDMFKQEGPKKEKKTKEPKKTPTGKPVGLGAKWGIYRAKLQWKDQTEFHQEVPAGSETITKALQSQNILDAVYHTDKAFWVADPKQYSLEKPGMSKMVYKFSAAGARSLMEDYLICGSGDFAEDNEEEWTGETAHPDYTIWKTNEVGAYGIGAARLARLAPFVESIEAYDPRGRKLSATRTVNQ